MDRYDYYERCHVELVDFDDPLRLGRHFTAGAPECIREHKRMLKGNPRDKDIPPDVLAALKARSRAAVTPGYGNSLEIESVSVPWGPERENGCR